MNLSCFFPAVMIARMKIIVRATKSGCQDGERAYVGFLNLQYCHKNCHNPSHAYTRKIQTCVISGIAYPLQADIHQDIFYLDILLQRGYIWIRQRYNPCLLKVHCDICYLDMTLQVCKRGVQNILLQYDVDISETSRLISMYLCSIKDIRYFFPVPPSFNVSKRCFSAHTFKTSNP